MSKNINYNKTMKKNFVIIYIIPRPDKGGAEFLVRQLFQYLKKKGFNVHTIYFNNPSKLNLKKNEHCLNFTNQMENFTSRIDPMNIWHLRKKIQQIKKNKNLILHAHLTWPLYLLPFSTFGIKSINIFTEHSSFYNRQKYYFLKLLERYIYSKYFKITCVSHGAKKNIIKWLGKSYNDKKTIVLSNGARFFKLTNRKNFKNTKIRLISVGSLRKAKGFDIAIRAISLIKHHVESYTILGEGNEKKNLISLANNLGIKDKIILPGYKKNLDTYYKNANLGLSPSRWEGFGLSVIEMLSSGLPLVCSNISGVNEIVNNCAAVKLVKSDNSHLLAKGILNLHRKIKKDGYKNISLTARIRAEKYSLKTMLKNYEQLYLNTFRKFN